MDIKLINNKLNRLKGIGISFLLLSLIAICAILSYPLVLKNFYRLQEKMEVENLQTLEEKNQYYKDEFLKEIYKGNYGLYLDILQQKESTYISPANAFLPAFLNSIVPDNQIDTNEEFFVYNFNYLINEWRDTFFASIIYNYELEYLIIDNSTGKELTNSVDSLTLIMERSDEAKRYKDDLTFYIVFQYDQDGNLKIPFYQGIEDQNYRNLLNFKINNSFIKEQLYLGDMYKYQNQVGSPKDVTIIYTTKMDEFYYGGNSYDEITKWQEIHMFGRGFVYSFALAFIAAILLSLLLPIKKSLELGRNFAFKIPFEVGFLLLFIPFAAYESLLYMALETAQGYFITTPEDSVLSELTINIFDYGINYFMWMLVLAVWFVAVLSIRPLFIKGLKGYIKENTLMGKVYALLSHKLKSFIKSMVEFDLKDNLNRNIVKLLGINFVIIALLCSFWFFGIVLLLPYTFILFHLLRKYTNEIKRKYTLLLEVTSSMSDGNLEIEIEEDLGLFNSLKDKLVKIQSGFKKAVVEETKSQKMKTELITNVSHDLKTPLTAIITYVNLLKENNITEEERNSYIDTLDKKSLRLKRLIEDLFDISKASSNNITLNLVDIDLVSLIKQVELELADKIEESNVEFRFHIPDRKVNLLLDSEKTYRIFENLIINITKYAMPNTRAYIDVLDEVDTVKVILKNISSAELDVSPNEISDRFVRGDKSRNTEGSGLGLAIVKSFVELQKGQLQITIDGDLFKVEIVWKKE